MSEAERVPYVYAVLRVVPRIERGERFNVGVALFCRRKRFLGIRSGVDEVKRAALAPDVATATIQAYLDAYRDIAAGDPSAGPLAALDQSERFHWLTSPSSTMIQPSRLHAGLTDDPAATLDRLFVELVSPVAIVPDREGHNRLN